MFPPAPARAQQLLTIMFPPARAQQQRRRLTIMFPPARAQQEPSYAATAAGADHAQSGSKYLACNFLAMSASSKMTMDSSRLQ